MSKKDLPCCNGDCNQGRFCLERLRVIQPDGLTVTDVDKSTWAEALLITTCYVLSVVLMVSVLAAGGVLLLLWAGYL
jgi:hypothetical protein